MKPLLDPILFDLNPQQSWVMHCAEGPIPRVSAAAAQDILGRELHPWLMRWQEDFQGIPASVRGEAAKLVGAQASDITLTPTTSSGLVTVAQGFSWEVGDEVVVPLGEFPSNAWPWKALAARGVSFREVPLWDGHRAGKAAWESTPPRAPSDFEQRLLDGLSPKTRVLAVSWVRFQDGLKLDLRTLAEGCALRGVSLVVDGVQGGGTLPPDLRGVAAFACGGHKGLLAPQGQGFLWTDPTFRLRLAPLGSWLSVVEATFFDRPSTDFDRDWAEDGTRLEQGVPNLLSCAALRESLELLNRVGVEAIAGHVYALQGQLLEGLARIDAWKAEAERLRALHEAKRLGSILSLHHEARGAQGLNALFQRGMERGVASSVREGYLRIALHGYNGGEDVARVLAWLAE